MSPAALAFVLLATLIPDDQVALDWPADPRAVAYRVYVCQAGEARCWGPQLERYWLLLGQQATPTFRGPRPDRPMWVAVANLHPGNVEVVRVGETIYVRPGPRYLTRPAP